MRKHFKKCTTIKSVAATFMFRLPHVLFAVSVDRLVWHGTVHLLQILMHASLAHSVPHTNTHTRTQSFTSFKSFSAVSHSDSMFCLTHCMISCIARLLRCGCSLVSILQCKTSYSCHAIALYALVCLAVCAKIANIHTHTFAGR